MFESLEDAITLLQQTLSQRVADQAGLVLLTSQDATAQAQIDQALLDAKAGTAAALQAQKDILAADDKQIVEILHSLSDNALKVAATLTPPVVPVHVG